MSHHATNWAIAQRGLKPAVKLVLWHLCDRHNPDHGCFPSQQLLADDCEMSRASINTHLAALEKAGLIAREPRIDPVTRRREATRYLFAFEPDFPGGPCPESGQGSMSRNEGEPCPESGPSHVQNLDTNLVREPVREPERESARAKPEGKPEDVADGMSVAEAWKRLGKSWPDIALQSEPLARGALEAMSAKDRERAVERVPTFVAMHRERRGKAALPYLHNYLGERHRWEGLAAPAGAGDESGEEPWRQSGIVPAWSRLWWFLLFRLIEASEGTLADPRSAASARFRRQVSLAENSIGWKVDPARLAECDAGAASFVALPRDGPEAAAWDAHLDATAGVRLPRPDAAHWIFVPPTGDQGAKPAAGQEARSAPGTKSGAGSGATGTDQEARSAGGATGIGQEAAADALAAAMEG